MLKRIDDILNKVTMYRLVLYYLAALWAIAILFSFAKILPYEPTGLVFSGLFITLVCWIANKIFSRTLGIHTNIESAYITALILTLIITPLSPSNASFYFPLAAWASVWAIASKYIFTFKKKHVFNPAAFGIMTTALFLNRSATWWVGTATMAPFVLVGGLLMTRKLLRSDLVLSFLYVALLTIGTFDFLGGFNIVTSFGKAVVGTPLLFFAFAMLTEPLTTPPTENKRMAYGALIGFLFAPQVHVGSFYPTPEIALLLGNVFSYLVSSKQRLILTLEKKIKIAPGLYDFVFRPDEKLKFKSGQYLEWTLSHCHPDNRGNRRYFTVASAPTEEMIRLGVKFHPDSSTFKKALFLMKRGETITASSIAGDFTLPPDPLRKLAFLAGGIGITPMRSMVKYLIDKNERRPLTTLSSNRRAEDIMYRDVFEEAEEKLGVKTFYTLTEEAPPGWDGERGRVTSVMIKKLIPDYHERLFYLSGTHAVVVAFEEMLKEMGIGKKRIKKDFFPGFA